MECKDRFQGCLVGKREEASKVGWGWVGLIAEWAGSLWWALNYVIGLYIFYSSLARYMKVLVSFTYSFLLLEYKSMAQEVLFCMQGCFYLSALSKGFTFILARSIYSILFVWTFQTRLSSQTGVVVYLFSFHLSALSNNLCTSTHAPGRTSLTLQGWQHMAIFLFQTP